MDGFRFCFAGQRIQKKAINLAILRIIGCFITAVMVSGHQTWHKTTMFHVSIHKQWLLYFWRGKMGTGIDLFLSWEIKIQAEMTTDPMCITRMHFIGFMIWQDISLICLLEVNANAHEVAGKCNVIYIPEMHDGNCNESLARPDTFYFSKVWKHIILYSYIWWRIQMLL